MGFGPIGIELMFLFCVFRSVITNLPSIIWLVENIHNSVTSLKMCFILCSRGNLATGKDAQLCFPLFYVRLVLFVLWLIILVDNLQVFDSLQQDQQSLSVSLQIAACSIYLLFTLADGFLSGYWAQAAINDDDDDDRITSALIWMFVILPVHLLCGVLLIASGGVVFDHDFESNSSTNNSSDTSGTFGTSAHFIPAPITLVILGIVFVLIGVYPYFINEWDEGKTFIWGGYSLTGLGSEWCSKRALTGWLACVGCLSSCGRCFLKCLSVYNTKWRGKKMTDSNSSGDPRAFEESRENAVDFGREDIEHRDTEISGVRLGTYGTKEFEALSEVSVKRSEASGIRIIQEQEEEHEGGIQVDMIGVEVASRDGESGGGDGHGASSTDECVAEVGGDYDKSDKERDNDERDNEVFSVSVQGAEPGHEIVQKQMGPCVQGFKSIKK